MNVYIKSMDGFPLEDWGCSALLGFKANGANVILFEEIEEVPLNRNVLLVSSIDDTKSWFKRMGWIENPEMDTIPMELNDDKFLNRHVEYSTLKEVREYTNFPVFVKPRTLKQFDAGVIDNNLQLLWLSDLPNDTPCLISEVLDIISEYRCYILEGKCVGVYNYLGDVFKFPDPGFINECIKKYESAPSAYALDIGITSDWNFKGECNKNVVIECNDFWSLGNYGLSPKLYSRGLMLRWRELLDLNKI